MDGLPLFDWVPPEPPPHVIPFPMHRRLGKIQDVVGKIATKTTQRHVDGYREQVTEALDQQMTRHGIAQDIRSREIGTFWQAVAVELARRGIPSRERPGAA